MSKLDVVKCYYREVLLERWLLCAKRSSGYFLHIINNFVKYAVTGFYKCNRQHGEGDKQFQRAGKLHDENCEAYNVNMIYLFHIIYIFLIFHWYHGWNYFSNFVWSFSMCKFLRVVYRLFNHFECRYIKFVIFTQISKNKYVKPNLVDFLSKGSLYIDNKCMLLFQLLLTSINVTLQD